MSPIELKIAEMLADLLEEITMGTGPVLSSTVKIIGTISRGYEVTWEGIVHLGNGHDDKIDPSEVDLGINQIFCEVLQGKIEWNTDQDFSEVNEFFTENLFEQNWNYDNLAITDVRMKPEMVKNVLDNVGIESIGSALLEFYGSEALVPFAKYPEFLANLLKDCIKEAISNRDD
jgi:hypothetical protein